MKKLSFYFLAAMLAITLTHPLMKGGSRTGSLGGEVTDPSGAVVPNAKILVSRDQWTDILLTDGIGRFVVTGLAPGIYEVSVSSDGFAPFDRSGLVVSAGDRTVVDAILNLPILKQSVRVTAESSPTHLSHLNDPAIAATVAGQ